ncbi:hypothetical protein CEXT_659771 [Caerostris extrusa]|uniref:Uncharacterized protein n=1 Tax=Caerostris extrusa TaxID=172846 RepID=A0AAV4PE57_CAEEX|nr:hypothetical protein CEXT_659771 [Caerostris extrusa]
MKECKCKKKMRMQKFEDAKIDPYYTAQLKDLLGLQNSTSCDTKRGSQPLTLISVLVPKKRLRQKTLKIYEGREASSN